VRRIRTDAQQMDEPQNKQGEGCPAPTRRDFLTTATISLTALLLNGTGCSEKPEAPNAADIENRSSLNAVPSRLVTFRESSRLPTGMRASRGIALSPDGSIWVAGDNEVTRLTADAKRFPIPLPSPPSCLAFGSDARIYVGLGTCVGVYNIAGSAVAQWAPISPAASITAIAPGKDLIWVADWAGKLIYGYDRTGVIKTTLCARNEQVGYPGIIAPSPHLDVVVDNHDRVHVSNPGMHRIETYLAKGGSLYSTCGAPGNDLADFCGCCNPVDFAIMPNGGFVTAEKGIPRVKIFNADGRFVEFVAGPDQFASNTMSLDLAVTRDGRVLVLDAIDGSVRIFSRMAPPPRDVNA